MRGYGQDLQRATPKNLPPSPQPSPSGRGSVAPHPNPLPVGEGAWPLTPTLSRRARAYRLRLSMTDGAQRATHLGGASHVKPSPVPAGEGASPPPRPSPEGRGRRGLSFRAAKPRGISRPHPSPLPKGEGVSPSAQHDRWGTTCDAPRRCVARETQPCPSGRGSAALTPALSQWARERGPSPQHAGALSHHHAAHPQVLALAQAGQFGIQHRQRIQGEGVVYREVERSVSRRARRNR